MEQGLAEMRAEKAAAAGDENAHGAA